MYQKRCLDFMNLMPLIKTASWQAAFPTPTRRSAQCDTSMQQTAKFSQVALLLVRQHGRPPSRASRVAINIIEHDQVKMTTDLVLNESTSDEVKTIQISGFQAVAVHI
ncbi:hypothetical protein Anapl_17883 [Anas platyrhynchos]|uniref:Uncharacterized protein n=1 Tax=Anas platyrhynchos TaxID=8839 RepID=R0L9A8_ANAPL|nr:hypothetical protein Anapl_17883 [Anas platyrhynchos]